MLDSTKLNVSDLSRQKRLTLSLDGELSPRHSVQQALERFLERSRIPDNGVPWSAISRGRQLDRAALLADLSDEDAEWLALPEISAG